MCGPILGQIKEGVNYIISEFSKLPLKGVQEMTWFCWEEATIIPASILKSATFEPTTNRKFKLHVYVYGKQQTANHGQIQVENFSK